MVKDRVDILKYAPNASHVVRPEGHTGEPKSALETKCMYVASKLVFRTPDRKSIPAP